MPTHSSIDGCTFFTLLFCRVSYWCLGAAERVLTQPHPGLALPNLPMLIPTGHAHCVQTVLVQGLHLLNALILTIGAADAMDITDLGLRQPSLKKESPNVIGDV
jgi:hypothetical protein